MFETKNAKVRRLVKEEKYKEALQICKEWIYENPKDREILRSGYDCMMYPAFYKQLGQNPEKRYQEAIAVLKRVYS